MFAVIYVLYAIGILLNIRGEFKSPDELFFSSSLDAMYEGIEIDWRYFLWIFYIIKTTAIHASLPLLVNLTLLVWLTGKVATKHIIPPWSLAIFLLLPTVFYFLNTYLRDIIFLIFSILLILHVCRRENSRIDWCLIGTSWVFVSLMRPFYGAILLFGYLVSSSIFKKYYLFLMLMLFLGIFIIASVVIYFNEEAFLQYKMFFIEGHYGNRDWGMTLMMVNPDDFTNLVAIKNILFAPIYFWIVPESGAGRIFDLTLYYENFIILVAIVRGLLKFNVGIQSGSRIYRLAVFMMLSSCVMAAATTTHDDAYRFRLIFMPFLIVFALPDSLRWVKCSGNQGSPHTVVKNNANC